MKFQIRRVRDGAVLPVELDSPDVELALESFKWSVGK
jgi:hypothetical protein